MSEFTLTAEDPYINQSEDLRVPGRIALTFFALIAIGLGVWRFGRGDTTPAVDAAFVAMTILVLVLGVREWVRVLQRTPRFFDQSARRLTRAYSRRDDSGNSSFGR